MMNETEFKWDAQLYQKNSLMQFQLGLRAIERLNLEGNEKILDIGCGNGILTIELAKLVPNGKITAIDTSKEMIEQARANFSEYGIKNVDTINLNAIDIKFNNEFDVVFSNFAIHWIQNLELMYDLLYKALKNDGCLMIQKVSKDMNRMINAWIRPIAADPEFSECLKKVRSPMKTYDTGKYRKLLESNNFSNVLVELYEYEFATIDQSINNLKAAALLPFLNRLPDYLKAKFLEKLKEIFLFGLNEAKMELKGSVLFISAEK